MCYDDGVGLCSNTVVYAYFLHCTSYIHNISLSLWPLQGRRVHEGERTGRRGGRKRVRENYHYIIVKLHYIIVELRYIVVQLHCIIDIIVGTSSLSLYRMHLP